MSSKGQLQALLLIIFLIVVLGIVFLVQPVVGPGANRAAASDTIAVLVIDAYEPLQDATLKWEDLKDKNCVVTPDGQGGLISKAGGLISKAGGLISKAGGLISKASGVEILQPHGRLVYNEIEGLLRDQGGQLQQVVPGTVQFGVDWIRDVGQWQLPEGNIVLVAVDTNDYATDAITTRLQETIRMLDEDMGVSKFVLNMSFAIVPCDDVKNTEDAYQKMLDDDFPGFEQLFDDLVNQGVDPATAIITAANTQVNGAPAYPNFFARVEALQPDVTQSVFGNCYPSSVIEIPKPGDGGTSTDGNSDNQSPPVLLTPTTPPDLSVAQSAVDVTPTIIVTPGADQTPEVVVTPGNPDTTTQQEPTPCDRIIQDPLAVELSRLQGQPLVRGNNATVFSIASAGNRGDSYAFAPGYYDSVVSVSADYNGPEYCPANPLDPVTGVPALKSNSGEVMMYGVYNCIPGTSFAAPRLSAEAALYLVRGGPISCQGANGTPSSPPMAHAAFDNLTRHAASEAYCQEFNTLLDVPLPTLVPIATATP